MKIIPLYNNFQNFSQIQQDLSRYEINNYIKRSQSPNQLQRNDSSFLQTSYDNVANKQDLTSYEISNYQNKDTNQNQSKTNFQSKDSTLFFTNYDDILNTSQQNHQNQNSNISISLPTQIASPEITTSVVYVNPNFSRIQKKTLKRHQLSPNTNHVSPSHSQANENNKVNLLKSQSTNNINNSLSTNLKRINIPNDIKTNISYTDIHPIAEIASTSIDITTPQKNSEIFTKFQEKQLKNSKSTTNYLYPKNINNQLLHSYDYNYNYNFTNVKQNNSNDNINSIVNNLFNNKNNSINNSKSSTDIFFNVKNEKDSMTSAKKNMNYFPNNYLNNSENNNANNLSNIFNENDFSKYNYDNNYLSNSNDAYNIIDNNYKVSNDINFNNISNSNKNSYNFNSNINKNLNNIYNYNNNQTNSKDVIYNYDYINNNNINDIKINNYSSYNHKMNNNSFNYNIYKNQLNNSKDISKSFNLNNKYNNNNFEIKSNNEYKSNSNGYNLNNNYNISNINTSASISTSINTNINSSINGSMNTNINTSINNYNDNNNYNINANEKNKLMNVITEIEPESNFKLAEFIKIKELGKGTEGTIYSVKWKRNNKIYALKKSSIGLVENVKKRQEEIKMLKDFRKRTGSDGVIRIYGDLCLKSKKSRYYYDFYEIMELAEIDWDQEIENRSQFNLYYSEYELMEIMGQIVKTFSLLQKNHITHRDIKPQNIMIVKGKFKICDFGNARILKREGLVFQRIRGSELYMSPIMFKGYHANKPQVKHNTFKSDVFSLGMCFLLAAALSYDPLNTIREIYDMNVIKKVMDHYLGQRYSQTVKNILIFMLQIEENMRPDFIQLERFFQQNNNKA